MEDGVDFLIKLTRIDQRISADQKEYVKREIRKIRHAIKGGVFQESDDDDQYTDSTSDTSGTSDSFSFHSDTSLDARYAATEEAEGDQKSLEYKKVSVSTQFSEPHGEAFDPGFFKPINLCCAIKKRNTDTRWDYGTAFYKQGNIRCSTSSPRNKKRSSLTRLCLDHVSVASQTDAESAEDKQPIDSCTCTAHGNNLITALHKISAHNDKLDTMRDIQDLKAVTPEVDAAVIKHLQSCSNWIHKRKMDCFRNVGHERRRVDKDKWGKWMSHMQDRMKDDFLFTGESRSKEDGGCFRKEKPIERWRRKAKLVRSLCGVCLTLRKYAVEAGLMNNFVVSVSSRRLCISGENGDVTEELEWDLDNYRAKQEIPIPRATIEMLEKLPQDRSNHDIQLIALLMRSLPSFRKYTSEMQKMMCRIVRYMRCTSRRVVLRKGHVGYSVYFIVRGSVSVVMGKDDQSVFVKPEVVILRKGACFGEIALLQNTRRNATIVCAEDCEFLVIDKEDFIQNGLNQRLDQEFTYRYSTYRNWPSIQSWDDDTIKRLAYCSRTEDFSHNKVIVQSSKVNEFLWFVVKGSCDVLRLVDLNNRPELTTLQTLPSGVQRFMASPSPRQPAEQETKKKRAQSVPLWPKSVLQRRVKSARLSQQQKHTIESDTSNESTCSSLSALNEKVSTLSTSSSSDSSSEVTLRPPPQSEQCRKVESKQLPSPIYVQVDQLRDGQCFGLESLFTDIDTNRHQYSLVSKGCVLIHVPRRKFLELTDDRSLQRIREVLKEYPDDHALIDGFLQKRIWDNFKQNIVEEVIIDKINTTGSGDKGLRGDKVEEYMRRKDTGDVAYGTMLNEEANTKTKHKLKSAVESRSARGPSTAQASSSINNNNSRCSTRLSKLLAAEQFTPRYPRALSYRSKIITTPDISQRLNGGVGVYRSPSHHRKTDRSHVTSHLITDTVSGSAAALGAKIRHLKSQSTVLSPRKAAGTEDNNNNNYSKATQQLKSRSIVVTSKEKREVLLDTQRPPRLRQFAGGRPQTSGNGLVYKITPRTSMHQGSGLHGENLLKSRSTVLTGE